MQALAHRPLVFLLFAGCIGAAQAQTAPAATPAPKPPVPLRVVVDPHSAPLVFKTGEKYSGLEAEFARGLGIALGRPVVFIEANWNDLIPALLADRADLIMSGMSVTDLRAVRVAFCDPYLRIGQVALCRRGDLSNYANNASLENLRADIGVVAGSTGDVLVGSRFSFASRKTFPTLPQAVRALLDKKLDLVMADYPLALWQSAENEADIAVVPAQLTQEDLAWAARKDDDVLRAAANAYLAQLKKTGGLAQIVHKWLPDAAAEAIGPGGAQPAAPKK